MTRLSQLKGQRVMTVDDARQVGSIRRLLIDVGSKSVVALHLEGVEGPATMLPWSRITSLGRDALMIESAAALRDPSEDEQRGIDTGAFDLEGRTVFSDAGDALGVVQDLEFDESSGDISAVHVPGHALPVPRLVAVGPDALIVPSNS